MKANQLYWASLQVLQLRNACMTWTSLLPISRYKHWWRFLFFFFNVIFIYGFPLHSCKFTSLPSLQKFGFGCTDFFFSYTQAAMSKKKDHSTLWTIQVDDAVDDMNDLLREAENLDDQVCSQPAHSGLVAWHTLMLANKVYCTRVRVPWKKVWITFYLSTFYSTEALN